MKKIYISSLKNYSMNGKHFTNYAYPMNGSYYATADLREQIEIESTKEYLKGSIWAEETAPEEPVVVEREEEPETEREGVYYTKVLQEARDIIVKTCDERGIERPMLSNKRQVLKEAEKLGIEFPKL